MITIKEVKDWAAQYAANLNGHDPRFQRSVQVHHMDGSWCFFNHAFVLYRGHHYIVFAEHHDRAIYHCEDVASVRQLEETKIEEL